MLKLTLTDGDGTVLDWWTVDFETDVFSDLSRSKFIARATKRLIEREVEKETEQDTEYSKLIREASTSIHNHQR